MFSRLTRRISRAAAPAPLVPAHDQAQTVHLLRHYEPHHARKGDPNYHLFEEAKARLKAAGKWHCVIGNEDCGGETTLHHSHAEFAYGPSVDVDRLNELLGLHLTDDEFARWIEEPGNLEVLCANHHLPGHRFAIHDIPAADWDIVRVHKKGLVPVEVVSAEKPESRL